MLHLNEDLFDDAVEIGVTEFKLEDSSLDGPETPEDRGITDLILSLINDENDTIQKYNSFIANLENYGDFIPVVNDIINEEMNHVGMLQTLLQRVSPNTENIEKGKAEADNIINNADIIDNNIIDAIIV